jgi:hypothetical protein
MIEASHPYSEENKGYAKLIKATNVTIVRKVKPSSKIEKNESFSLCAEMKYKKYIP